jgi:hypothetical protein
MKVSNPPLLVIFAGLAASCASSAHRSSDQRMHPSAIDSTLSIATQGAQPSPQQAQPAAPREDGPFAPLLDALVGGRAWFAARYRYEDVDQDGFDDDAHASTLRTVLGYETKPYHDVQGLIEFEDVTAIGNDLYNSTTNGETGRPTVVDPEDTEVNQALVKYAGVPDASVLVGRRVLILDNHRFVGDVGWRQNQQTFDVVSVEYTGLESAGLFYAWMENANRIFGDSSPQGDARMASNLVNASYDAQEYGKLVGYWYDLDFDDLTTLSTSTVGARYTVNPALTGELKAVGAAEYAQQVDTGANPNDVDAGYELLELGVSHPRVAALAGLEVLEGSTTAAGDKFTTPLATLHKFQGWADQFLNTPDTGIEDLYLSLSGSADKLGWAAIWHEFDAEAGSMDYGSELDLQLTYAVSKRLAFGLKYADYDADDFSVDTRKVWGWMEVRP